MQTREFAEAAYEVALSTLAGKQGGDWVTRREHICSWFAHRFKTHVLSDPLTHLRSQVKVSTHLLNALPEDLDQIDWHGG